ncbi:MAG: cupin domain-containing protein [Polyangiaceae bacterium]|jgi:uncharacterized cupin superfamily protein
MLAKRVTELAARSRSVLPAHFRDRILPREVRALGDAFGLTAIGVNLVTLFPGKESSLRHHHSHEDELIYVLEGALVLHTHAGEEPLTAGMAAGFRAGDGNGHHLYNRSDKPATYLVVSNRHPEDQARYPDDDLAVHKGPDATYVFTRKSGAPITD